MQSNTNEKENDDLHDILLLQILTGTDPTVSIFHSLMKGNGKRWSDPIALKTLEAKYAKGLGSNIRHPFRRKLKDSLSEYERFSDEQKARRLACTREWKQKKMLDPANRAWRSHQSQASKRRVLARSVVRDG